MTTNLQHDFATQTFGQLDIATAVSSIGAGVSVTTPDGAVPTDWLRPGDKVMTWDAGWQEVKWVGSNALRAPNLFGDQVYLPGTGRKNLAVGAETRVLLSGWELELHFGAPQMLARAGWFHEEVNTTSGHQVHILLETPQLVAADGLWIETLQLTDHCLDSLSPKAQGEIERLDLDLEAHILPTLPCLSHFEIEVCGPDAMNMLAQAKSAKSAVSH